MASVFTHNIGSLISNKTGIASNVSTPTSDPVSENQPFVKPVSVFGTDKTTRQKYNELYHEVELYLDNSGNFEGKEEFRFHINPSAVLNLTISDVFNNWCAEGTMTFLYLPDDAPGSPETGQTSDTVTKGAQDNANMLKAYQFRGDGFDLLRVRISPKIKEEAQSGNQLSIDDDDAKWWLTYYFGIYDFEDISDIPEALGPASFYMKCIKLYFRDIRYQILKSTNIEYSTATSTVYQPQFNTGLSNEGCLKVGNAILDVWNKVLSDPNNGGSEEFAQLANDTWDSGENFIFYTSPANYNALDDISYLASHYVTSKPLEGTDNIKDIGIMHSIRSQEAGRIPGVALSPITKFFEKATEGESAGELQLEHFFVTSNSQEETGQNTKTSIQQYKSPFSTSNDRDLKTAKYGQVLSYSFVDMAPEMNSGMFNNLPVYSVDIRSRKFRVEFEKNTVTEAKRIFGNSYIKNLYKGSSGNNEQLFLPTLHISKKNRNVFPIYTLNGDNVESGKITRQKSGIHQLLYTGLFQNACLCFKTLGLTLRQSGSFIALDKMEGCQDSDYNNKLYGQWFVVKVDHLFEAGAYVNIIYAIKIHRYSERSQKFNNTLENNE